MGVRRAGFIARGKVGLVLLSLAAWSLSDAQGAEAKSRTVPARVLHAGDAGSPGNAASAGEILHFKRPTWVATDRAGNLFVTETENYTIRKIASNGGIATFAGLAGTPGHTDGVGEAALFNAPAGLAADRAGNVYVADHGNHTIRKITPKGEVSTLAGLPGKSGSTDGTGVAARFDSPTGLAIDGADNLYVTDAGNHTIRKISPTGAVTTLAGRPGHYDLTDGLGAAASFRILSGLAIDGAGTIYVVDDNTIRKITPDGEVSTFAGNPKKHGRTDGVGAEALFDHPRAIAIDGAGNLFVMDGYYGFTIRKISPAGLVSTIAGSDRGYVDGVGKRASFDNPHGLAFDAVGNLYVADTSNLVIRKITLTGEVSTLSGSEGGGSPTVVAGRMVIAAGSTAQAEAQLQLESFAPWIQALAPFVILKPQVLESAKVEGLKPGFFVVALGICGGEPADELLRLAQALIPEAYERTVRYHPGRDLPPVGCSAMQLVPAGPAKDTPWKLDQVRGLRSGDANLAVLPFAYERGDFRGPEYKGFSILALLLDRNRTLVVAKTYKSPSDFASVKSVRRGARIVVETEYVQPRCVSQSGHLLNWSQNLSVGSDGQRISINAGEAKQLSEIDCKTGREIGEEVEEDSGD